MANVFRNDFSGGAVAKKGKLKLADNEVRLALNYRLDQNGDLVKRYGYTKIQSSLVTTTTSTSTTTTTTTTSTTTTSTSTSTSTSSTTTSMV